MKITRAILRDIPVNRTYNLTELVQKLGQVTIGRNRDNTIALGIDENNQRIFDKIQKERLRQVSRYHAIIYQDKRGHFYLRNKSQNHIHIGEGKKAITLEISDQARLKGLEKIFFVRYGPITYQEI